MNSTSITTPCISRQNTHELHANNHTMHQALRHQQTSPCTHLSYSPAPARSSRSSPLASERAISSGAPVPLDPAQVVGALSATRFAGSDRMAGGDAPSRGAVKLRALEGNSWGANEDACRTQW
eukprot:1156182-Pelagomonas_calceolata.AAC.2